MAADTDAPVDLYVAAYLDPDAARADWDAIKQLAADDTIKVEGLDPGQPPLRRQDPRRRRLPHRRQGRRLGRDRRCDRRSDLPARPCWPVRWSAPAPAWESVAWCRHGEKAEIKADVEDTLPLNSSGIVAMFDEQWATDVDKALTNANKVTKDQVDGKSAGSGQGRSNEERPAEGVVLQEWS